MIQKIKQLINKGYVLVSDEFTQAQDAGKAVFDQDGNAYDCSVAGAFFTN